MRRLSWTAAGAAALALGCFGVGRAPEPGVLGYDVPDPNPATYAFTDTAVFTVDAGPIGSMEIVSAHAGLAEVEFRHGPAGLEVLVRFPRYAGRLENPGQRAVTADESDIRGAYAARLDAGGGIEIMDAPALGAAARAVTGPESLLRPLFARLPARTVQPGSVWVDTVSFTDRGPATTAEFRRITTSTLVGDTLAGGRRLLVIRTDAVDEVDTQGLSGGVAVRRRLTGRTRGRVLWDPARGLLVERIEEGELSGTLDMPGVGITDLTVRARVRRTVSAASPRP